MSPEEGFLLDIEDHPADDTARLVYADWLEERGDPRGRYLRAEVELAGLSEGDPRYAVLEEELRRLRPDIDPIWLTRAGKRYELLLHSYPQACKINLILRIRELTGRGLKEAKDLCESQQPILIQTGLTRREAERGRDSLRAGHGNAELRVAGV